MLIGRVLLVMLLATLFPSAAAQSAQQTPDRGSPPSAIDDAGTEPSAPIVTPIALQRFERGFMLWRRDEVQITVVYDRIATPLGTPCEEVFWDTYVGQDYALGPAPPGRTVPTLGFGWLYANDPAMADRLGYALADEVSVVAEVRIVRRDTQRMVELRLSEDLEGIANPLLIADADEPALAFCFPRGPAATTHRPASREGAATMWDPTTRRLLLFGGNVPGRGYVNDVWSYDPLTNIWTPRPPAGPAPLGPVAGFSTAVWDTSRGRVLLFSSFGDGPGPEFRNILWDYDPRKGTWEPLAPAGPIPPGRTGHVAVWDEANMQLLLYGGWTGTRALGDLWSYRPAENRWGELIPDGPPPPPRFEASAVWDRRRQQMLVFGGIIMGRDGMAAPVNELWQYRSAENRWTRSPLDPSVPIRSRHGAVMDEDGRQMLVLGGIAYTQVADNVLGPPQGDLWRFEITSDRWTPVRVPGPEPPLRISPALALDPTQGRLYVFGGSEDNAARNDLWQLDLASWSWRHLTDGEPASLLR